MKKQVMKKAWTIRREAAHKWNCHVSEIHFGACLSLAWKSMTTNTLTKVQDAIASFDFTAEQAPDGNINVYNSKGDWAAVVKESGEIERKHRGRKSLCGSLVRDAIKTVI